MILSYQSIKRRCLANGMVAPYHERTKSHGLSFGAGPAGYDVRLRETLIMSRGGFALASTIEHFQMPNDVLGRVADKSTWARRGLQVQNTIIEPGWHGFLTLELTYVGTEPLQIVAGMPIAQIIFDLVDLPTEQPYAGKYSGQPAHPVEAILEAGE